MSKLPLHGNGLQQQSWFYPLGLCHLSILVLQELKQLSSVGKHPFSGWGTALPSLHVCASHNGVLVPEGSLQAGLQLK